MFRKFHDLSDSEDDDGQVEKSQVEKSEETQSLIKTTIPFKLDVKLDLNDKDMNVEGEINAKIPFEIQICLPLDDKEIKRKGGDLNPEFRSEDSGTKPTSLAFESDNSKEQLLDKTETSPYSKINTKPGTNNSCGSQRIKRAEKEVPQSLESEQVSFSSGFCSVYSEAHQSNFQQPLSGTQTSSSSKMKESYSLAKESSLKRTPGFFKLPGISYKPNDRNNITECRKSCEVKFSKKLEVVEDTLCLEGGTNLSKRKKRNDVPTKDLLCAVCGSSRMVHRNYGALTCNRCRQIFRYNRKKTLHHCCKNRRNMKKCTKCTYLKCVQLGMKMRENIQQPSTLQQPPVAADASLCLEELSDDLSKLLDSRKCTYQDVQLKCGNQIILAHKSVLSARSEVFAAMLQNDTVEGRTVVEIQDMEEPVFKKFIRYLYTGKISELTVDIAMKFYEASNKYAVKGLMHRCFTFLARNFTLENACDCLILADTHSDQDFKKRAIDYILEEKIPLEDDLWTPFCDRHPKLANEVLNMGFKLL